MFYNVFLPDCLISKRYRFIWKVWVMSQSSSKTLTLTQTKRRTVEWKWAVPVCHTLRCHCNIADLIYKKSAWSRHALIGNSRLKPFILNSMMVSKLFSQLTHFIPLVFQYPLKTWENQRFSDVFRSYRKFSKLQGAPKNYLISLNIIAWS